MLHKQRNRGSERLSHMPEGSQRRSSRSSHLGPRLLYFQANAPRPALAVLCLQGHGLTRGPRISPHQPCLRVALLSSRSHCSTEATRGEEDLEGVLKRCIVTEGRRLIQGVGVLPGLKKIPQWDMDSKVHKRVSEIRTSRGMAWKRADMQETSTGSHPPSASLPSHIILRTNSFAAGPLFYFSQALRVTSSEGEGIPVPPESPRPAAQGKTQMLCKCPAV